MKNRIGVIKTTYKHLGHLEIKYESELYNGEILDTRVIIEGQIMIWIAGDTIEEFHEKLKQVIQTYRI